MGWHYSTQGAEISEMNGYFIAKVNNYVHYFDCKIALMTSKVKLKFLISHRILQTPHPPRTPDPLSLNHSLFSRVFI